MGEWVRQCDTAWLAPLPPAGLIAFYPPPPSSSPAAPRGWLFCFALRATRYYVGNISSYTVCVLSDLRPLVPCLCLRVTRGEQWQRVGGCTAERARAGARRRAGRADCADKCRIIFIVSENAFWFWFWLWFLILLLYVYVWSFFFITITYVYMCHLHRSSIIYHLYFSFSFSLANTNIHIFPLPLSSTCMIVYKMIII